MPREPSPARLDVVEMNSIGPEVPPPNVPLGDKVDASFAKEKNEDSLVLPVVDLEDPASFETRPKLTAEDIPFDLAVAVAESVAGSLWRNIFSAVMDTLAQNEDEVAVEVAAETTGKEERERVPRREEPVVPAGIVRHAPFHLNIVLLLFFEKMLAL